MKTLVLSFGAVLLGMAAVHCGSSSDGAGGDDTTAETGGGSPGTGGTKLPDGGSGTGGAKATGGGSGTGGANPGTGGSPGGGGTITSGAGGWVPVDAGHQAIWMAAAPTAADVYMFDRNQKQLFVTADKGATWTGLAKTVDALPLDQVWDPADTTDKTYWIGGMYGSSGIYHTTDGGTSFTTTCFAHLESFSIDLTDPARQTMLGTAHGNGDITMSTDGGGTCASIKGSFGGTGATSWGYPHIVDTKTFLVGAGGTDAFLRSTDGGATWKSVANQDPSNPIDIAPDGTFVWGLFWNRGLMKSTDKGVTWRQTVNYGVLEGGQESQCGTFLADGRLVWIKAVAWQTDKAGQLMISSDFAKFTNFLDPFPVNGLNLADESVGVIFSKATNSMYTWTRYGKISRWDLGP